MTRGVAPGQMQLDAIGEEHAATHALDDPRDRAVILWVKPKLKNDPPPPRKVPPKPKPLISQKFKLAMPTGISGAQAVKFARFLKVKVGASVNIDAIFFIVWDTTNNQSCIYGYVGLGIGAGLAVAPKLSGTMQGPWNSFTTSAPISCAQFGRLARFTTAGAARWSLNWITIWTPKGVDNVYERIDTGTTLGAAISTTVGDFIRLEGPSPVAGP